MYQHLPMLVLRAAATLSSVFMYLSPFGMVRNISKAKSTEPHSFWPILAALGNSTLWTTYGLLSFDIFPLFVTNFIGALLNLYYCRVFYLYEKKRILFLTSSFILFSLLIIIIWETVSDEEEKEAIDRLGLIGCFVCILMFAAPLSTILTVIRTKSAKSLPRSIILANLLTSGLWTIYGIIKHNKYIYGPNGTGVVLAIIQVYLYGKYSQFNDHEESKRQAELRLRRLSNPFQKYSFIDDSEDDDYRKILKV